MNSKNRHSLVSARDSLERQRRYTNKAFWAILATGCALSLTISAALTAWLGGHSFSGDPLFVGMLLWGAAGTAVAAFALRKHLNEIYRQRINHELIPVLIESVLDETGLHHEAAQPMSIQHLRRSGLVDLGDEQCLTDSLLLGIHPQIELCHLATYEIRKNPDGYRKIPLDRGLFVRIELEIEPGFTLFVRDRKPLSTPDKIRVTGFRYPRVREAAPQFNEHYMVYTDDPVAALRYLTPRRMEEMDRIADLYVTEFAVRENDLYLFFNGATLTPKRLKIKEPLCLEDLSEQIRNNLKLIQQNVNLLTQDFGFH